MTLVVNGNEIKQLKVGDWVLFSLRKGYYKITKIEPVFFTEEFRDSHYKGYLQHSYESEPPYKAYRKVAELGDELGTMVHISEFNLKTGKVGRTEKRVEICYVWAAEDKAAKEIAKYTKMIESLRKIVPNV